MGRCCWSFRCSKGRREERRSPTSSRAGAGARGGRRRFQEEEKEEEEGRQVNVTFPLVESLTFPNASKVSAVLGVITTSFNFPFLGSKKKKTLKILSILSIFPSLGFF